LLGTAAAEQLSVPLLAIEDGEFLAYIAKFGKSYASSGEFQTRKALFLKKNDFINFFNN